MGKCGTNLETLDRPEKTCQGQALQLICFIISNKENGFVTLTPGHT